MNERPRGKKPQRPIDRAVGEQKLSEALQRTVDSCRRAAETFELMSKSAGDLSECLCRFADNVRNLADQSE